MGLGSNQYQKITMGSSMNWRRGTPPPGWDAMGAAVGDIPAASTELAS